MCVYIPVCVYVYVCIEMMASVIPSFQSVFGYHLYGSLFFGLDPRFSWWLTHTDSFIYTPDGRVRSEGHLSPVERTETKGTSSQKQEEAGSSKQS